MRLVSSNLLKMGFLGGGKTAQAMAKGFISAGLVSAKNITASFSPNDEVNMREFKEMGCETFVDNMPVVKQSEVVFISVKPWIVPTVLQRVNMASADKLFISVAMGLGLAELEASLLPTARVVRVMPNTPTLVRCGAAVYVRGKAATDDDCSLVQTLFESVGTCEEVTEALIDPITALSGSGPGYVFTFIEAMADGAVKMGLSRDIAYRLAAQTVMGAGKMVLESGAHPGQLKDDVASPAGSTIAGLSFLEKHAFRHIVSGAIETATLRCREVSKKK
ncbi:pyrroline-5-carboxylate reductase 3-like [Toxorhynchites rutilus septentrionalis]|uniref:pyrroline-5-carboxylate reductase 3-like n=1 Tax=Toxorhynchites rutilus septentrionalis TaxID=329112 RepID=UPI0024792C47|nr:pyrroline-5-carboxylate reductase 3-like [Toxorhynchites rutilus septentrionalis]